MATLDRQSGAVVVRIVYDGPALAGKTTSVRALARSLGRPVFSGDEAEGRTLHFDWVDYVGGRFEGYAIRCQVVAVPGQPALASRRMRLLETADAVVFVADSRAEALDESLRSLDQLRAFLQARPAAPGLVLQANKRDAEDAVPLDLLRAHLQVGPVVGVTQSVATESEGIRETFVLAVRLALDLVRDRLLQRTLQVGPPEVESGEELMAALLAAEDARAGGTPAPVAASPAPGQELPAAPAVQPAVSAPPRPVAAAVPLAEGTAAVAPASGAVPRAPDATVASGLVWPPIEGRLALHEAHSLGITPRRLENGDWWAAAGVWRCHSAQAAVFADSDQGRADLVDWARWHAGVARWLSPRRCIALCQAGPGSFRLWQIVRHERSVRDVVIEALASSDADAAAAALLGAVRVLGEAEDKLAPLGLPVAASRVGASDAAGAVYVGLVPRAAPHAAAGAASLADRVRVALSPVIRQATIAPGLSVPRLLERLSVRARGSASGGALETLQALLIGH